MKGSQEHVELGINLSDRGLDCRCFWVRWLGSSCRRHCKIHLFPFSGFISPLFAHRIGAPSVMFYKRYDTENYDTETN